MNNRFLVAGLGLVLGVLLVLAIRFAVYATPAQKVHYHANFAVYINGQRERFKASKYYEETSTATCSVQNTASEENNPMSRVHMHSEEYDVVHVEDHLVSWGNFFAVLGWGIGNNYLSDGTTVYTTDGQNKLTYILNGKSISNVSNLIIGDQDKLLVNYGSQDPAQINQEYGAIQNNALKEDNSKDPAACGSNEKTVTTFHDRMTHMF